MLCRCASFSLRKVVCVCCLSPCGESGLKYGWGIAPSASTSRLSPCGESGLKYHQLQRALQGSRLSPCGESGLKSLAAPHLAQLPGSLPMRGEWIEMARVTNGIIRTQSLSPCGESGLKSSPCEYTCRTLYGLSPCGESGLKSVLYNQIQLYPETYSLSPCGESGLKCYRI